VQVFDDGAGPQQAVSSSQYRRAGSDGAHWLELDPTNLSLLITPPADCLALLGGSADLWTATAGYNQDLGIAVSGGAYPTVAGQPGAWKESGGRVATYSPNAAFVQSVLPLAAGVPYRATLQWKTNRPAGPTAAIFAGAGAVAPYSPTSLVAQLFCPHLAITSPPQFFQAGTLSGPFTVQLQDLWGFPFSAGTSGQVVNLSSTSTTGVFTPGPTITIAPGANSATFQYTDVTVGQPTIIASAPGLRAGREHEVIFQ